MAPGLPFNINPGLNDAWFNPATAGQGFFFVVFPDIELFFLSWFTYDVERPDESIEAILGEPGHRWVTAFGDWDGNTVTLDVELTSGGIFDSAEPPVEQESNYGTITIVFLDCNSATLTYDFPDLGLMGVIELTRVTDDNVALCGKLNAQQGTHISLSIPDGALPEGVTPDDLTISEVSIDPNFYTEQGVEPPLAHIELKPDGLQFSEPVILNIQMPVENPSDRQLQVYHTTVVAPASEEEPPVVAVEFISNAEIEVDMETNRLIASIPLTHFSGVHIVNTPDVFVSEISTTASEVLFGDTFTVEAVVKQKFSPGQALRIWEEGTTRIDTFLGHAPEEPGNDTWQLFGYFDTTPVESVGPTYVDDRPPVTFMGTARTYMVPSTEFVCQDKWSIRVTYYFSALYSEHERHISEGWGGEKIQYSLRRKAQRKSIFVDLNCFTPRIVVSQQKWTPSFGQRGSIFKV